MVFYEKYSLNMIRVAAINPRTKQYLSREGIFTKTDFFKMSNLINVYIWYYIMLAIATAVFVAEFAVFYKKPALKVWTLYITNIIQFMRSILRNIMKLVMRRSN